MTVIQLPIQIYFHCDIRWILLSIFLFFFINSLLICCTPFTCTINQFKVQHVAIIYSCNSFSKCAWNIFRRVSFLLSSKTAFVFKWTQLSHRGLQPEPHYISLSSFFLNRSMFDYAIVKYLFSVSSTSVHVSSRLFLFEVNIWMWSSLISCIKKLREIWVFSMSWL